MDEVIRDRLRSDVVLVRQVADYIIGGGGKRMRPALVILTAGACGYTGAQHHLLAAVIEFIHTATLLHDDVVDDSHMRRGRVTANAHFGNPPAVLVGDFLYSRAFQMMVEVQNLRVMDVLAEATNVIAEGEVLQLLHVHSADVTEDEYLQVIRSKTAKLFEAAARLGGILAGVSRAREDALGAYGMHLGTAFQLIDDVLDYAGDISNTGKNIGTDLAEGKTTLPLIHAMKHGNAAQVALIRNAIIEGGAGNFPAVMGAVRDTGALEHVRRQAQAAASRARQAIDSLENSKYRDCLLELPAFAVNRNH